MIGRPQLLRACLIAGVLVLAAAGAISAADGSHDQRFLAGLRQRRLFELAESYCSDRLKDPQLSGSRRAELVMELSLVLSDWAVHSAPDQREPLWSRALEVTEAFAQQHPQSPQLLLVRLQGALGLLARGELTRQEAQLAAQGDRRLGEARTSLQSAIRRLQELGEEVELKLRERIRPARTDARPDQLTVHQLTSLRDNIRYQLARAYRNQAQCYPADSPDWANSLTLAAKMLDPLAKFDLRHPLARKSRLDEIVCYRLLADYPTALQKLNSLWAEPLTPAFKLRCLAERIRLAWATEGLSKAQLVASGQRELEGVTSAELDYALLELYLASWRAAGRSNREDEAARWQAKVKETVRLIQGEHGPYWTRRAQMLLARHVQGFPGGNLEMWIQAAENSYHSGQYDEALAAYDRARALAQEQGNDDEAFRLGFIAATIEHHRQRHAQAMSRYRALAVAMPNQKRAPEAHLLALYHAGQLAKQQPTASQEQYIVLAEEHLGTWPDAPTADEVRWRLGGLRYLAGEWQRALDQYQAISPDYPKFAQVVEAVARSYEAWLKQSAGTAKPTEQIASAAAGWFESLVVGPQGQLPERWSPLHRQAALAAARFRLDYSTGDFGRAEQILSAALDASPDAPPEWQAAAKALLVSSLAAAGRPGEAAAVLEQISSGPPEQLLTMLKGLRRIAATSGPEVRAELAELELSAVELLRPRRAELSQAGQRTLDRIAAQALADAGRSDAALAAYHRLSQTYPLDGQIQEGYARLLLTRQDPASRKAALSQWREVEKKSRPGTDRWFRAKLAVALLHYRSNNVQQAEKMIKLLVILHPEPKLGDRPVTARFADSLDPPLKARFLELLNRCEVSVHGPYTP